jgi:hypothetical protein
MLNNVFALIVILSLFAIFFLLLSFILGADKKATVRYLLITVAILFISFTGCVETLNLEIH